MFTRFDTILVPVNHGDKIVSYRFQSAVSLWRSYERLDKGCKRHICKKIKYTIIINKPIFLVLQQYVHNKKGSYNVT